jgi:hypothetical protein
MAARAGECARQEGLIDQDGSPAHLQRECDINFSNYAEGIAEERTRAPRGVLGHALFQQNIVTASQRSMPAMLQPHFWNFLGNNRILAGAAIVRAKRGAIAFGSFQSPG